MNLMYFLHDNTSVEWSMSKYNDGSSIILNIIHNNYVFRF